ncbi:MAG: type I glutamate--ammonia ligase [Leptospiraceae bacterium]|nr:type I glutamate--ammonia ligase [Leptospiraceae bacterium]MCB1320724.1 type I glutamate--ammonia ligase [Leptospiraceae bacterium]
MSLPTDHKELLKWAKAEKVEFVDVRFTDMLGLTHHFTSPLSVIDEEAFTYGIGIDGSSVRGWKSINESDMLARLDASSAFLDPFFEHKTLNVLCDIYDPRSGEAYGRDPRTILKRSLEYMKSTGIADQAFFGPEAEFFIFSDVRFDSTMQGGYYHVDALDAAWNMGKDEGPNLGHKMRLKGGYFPTPPNDIYQDLRSEVLAILESIGVETEKHHHEVASAGQGEINLMVAEGIKMADNMIKYKYVLKNVARRHGFTVTFMPKPVWNDNGTGMHTHQSIWKGGKNLFAGDKYAGLSDMALNYIGGIIENGPSVLAFTNPTTNSYKRLVPGFEAPVTLVYSARNRSASIRIPIAVGSSEKARRIEFRTPDASSCPYLAFAAMLMAGLDGVQKKTDPGEPADFDLYEASEEQLSKLKKVPESLDRVLEALGGSSEFLQVGNVFEKDFIDSYIEYKEGEVKEIRNQRPHPYEFVLYYDC